MPDDNWVKVAFDVSAKFQGCTVEFRDGSTRRLDEAHLKKKLFRETRTGMIYDAHQMLSGFYKQTNTTPKSSVGQAAVAEAFEKGVSTGKPDLSITFTPGVFSFRANSGLVGIARIVFDVHYTVRPKKSS